jgi:HK97 family phage prohead protease
MDKITLPMSVKQINTDDDYFIVEGHVAAYGNVDYGDDRIEHGAFSDFLKNAASNGQVNVPTLWSHRHNEPIGIMPISDMREDDKGLFIRSLMPKDDDFVKGRVMPQVRVGSVRQMSIGYDAEEWGYDGDIRVLKKLHLWEGSLTPIAMNERATVTSFKTVVPFGDLPLADRTRAWDSDSAMGRVREWSGINGDGDLSDPDVQSKYRKAFFWYASADGDTFDAYRLPFADVIDGKLTAVPRGIFAAAASMRGARDGVYLPQNDRPGVIRNIEKYYEKIGLESPFGKSFRVDSLKTIDVRDLEKILRSGARFPAKTAVAIISAIKSAGLRDVDPTDNRDGNEAECVAINNKLDEILNLF